MKVLLKKKELANASMHLVEREDCPGKGKGRVADTIYKKRGITTDM